MNDQATMDQAEEEMLASLVSDEDLEAAANSEKIPAHPKSAYDYTCVFNPAPGC